MTPKAAVSISLHVMPHLLLLALLCKNSASHGTSPSSSQVRSDPLCKPLGSHAPVSSTWSHSVPLGSGSGVWRSHVLLNCSDPHRLITVQVRPHAKGRGATVRVFLCPAVSVLRLQLLAENDCFGHVPYKTSLTSCVHVNDTVVIRKGRHRLHVTMTVVRGHASPVEEWLQYSYSVPRHLSATLHNKASQATDDIQEHHTTTTNQSTPLAPLRWRRSALSRDPRPLATPGDNSDFHPQGLAAVRSTKECGVTKSCIRYGREGCGHLSCDYMLSYVVNKTDVDLQMSARGTGWVAVGFSSDKFMGGGDDVIACKRERKLSFRVVTLSLGNTVKHTRPQQKTNRLNQLEGLLQDDHIYCRVTRPLEFPNRLADSDLDLVNDWHQLYAYGNIDGNGRILQHTEAPRVSEQKITMVRLKNIMITTSRASLAPQATRLTSLLLLSLLLLLTFAGS